MTPADLETWESELEGLFARLRPLFYRTESKKHAQQYVRGLLSPMARKNGWTIAEHVGEPEPTPLPGRCAKLFRLVMVGFGGWGDPGG